MVLINRTRACVARTLQRPRIRRILERLPLSRRHYTGWRRTHPFDQTYGVETSGADQVTEFQVDPALARHMSPYAGSQPSIIRRAIAALPIVREATFIDLGCGKGRPLVVASEFPFRRIIGVELAPHLVSIARTNAAIVRRRFPERPIIEIVEDDATRFHWPDGKLVLFCYNSFDAEFVDKLVSSLERALTGSIEHLFVVYYNPVWGALFDGSSAFQRWYAATLAYDVAELGFGPDQWDSVVIWQSVRNAYPRRDVETDGRIQTDASSQHVELV
jgi:SAM-dependent methyltransferase